MSLDLRPLDLDDEAQLRAYWEVGRDVAAERPYSDHLAWPVMHAFLRTPRSDRDEVRFCAWEGDRMVGLSGVQLPLLESTELAHVFVEVLPEGRGRGTGAALLDASEEAARAHGRTAALGWAYAPVGAESAGTRFAAQHGYAVELEEGTKVLDLTTGRERWPGLAEETAPHHAAYRLVTVWGPVPDDLVEEYCRLNSAFNGEAPSGETPVDLEHWDVPRMRELEERMALVGRRELYTFALAASGEMAALTEVVVDQATPERAGQGGTLVMPDHRGHRLGLAVKVANLRALVAAQPDLEWILTGNADVNVHMNAINEQLGFRVVERCLELRRTL